MSSRAACLCAWRSSAAAAVSARHRCTTPLPPAEGGTLVLFNWEEYIGSDTVAGFEKETGIDVQELYFTDEEESMGAVQADPSAYDLAVISDDLVREMRRAKILSPLDKGRIPNLKNIGERFQNPSHDPELKYTVPYLWGTTGMVINTKFIKEDRDSWKVLFDPRYAGRIAMLAQPLRAPGAGCKLLGTASTPGTPAAKARELLRGQKKFLKGYLDYLTLEDLLVSEDLWAAQMYSGEATRIMSINKNLEFVFPTEGAALWLDSFVIPRGAKHKEEAHRFLDYILRTEVNAAIASELGTRRPTRRRNDSGRRGDECSERLSAARRARAMSILPDALRGGSDDIFLAIWEELQQ